ncbi:hypothetical protein [Sphingobacterium sp. JUb56]|uniref:hypothetical protein n=1 Tax=Sphingobacterium sp. JUb56 TaxID=2587145 RepID=UPI0016085861|nr:hypothetical protein [Sphingobacterium sp. JUb56]MBB2951951.1 hypothetical protein [Sphingobacterium sp. JUb56]
MSVLKIIVNKKEVLIPYKFERKYGLVNYIINGKNGAVYYFRKYDEGDFHLAYGTMKEELAGAIIESIKEIHK